MTESYQDIEDALKHPHKVILLKQNSYQESIHIINSLAKEVMFLVALVSLSVCLFVCLSVCLSVDNITQNVMNGLG